MRGGPRRRAIFAQDVIGYVGIGEGLFDSRQIGVVHELGDVRRRNGEHL